MTTAMLTLQPRSSSPSYLHVIWSRQGAVSKFQWTVPRAQGWWSEDHNGLVGRNLANGSWRMDWGECSGVPAMFSNTLWAVFIIWYTSTSQVMARQAVGSPRQHWHPYLYSLIQLSLLDFVYPKLCCHLHFSLKGWLLLQKFSVVKGSRERK